ncbi:MAG: roadblock/LC7 domain-containing protein [Caldisericia bacterium]|nr:roadblock/LC7 domain-containing protein [Caldisericia bacterium]
MNDKFIIKLLEKSYKKIPTCEMIVLGSPDGISLASFPRNNEMVDSVAATSTSITGLADAASEYLEKGQVQYSLIRSAGGFILVIGGDIFNLFIMAGKKVNLGLLLLVGNKLADELSQVIADISMKEEMEEDVHLLARELSESVGDSKAQMDVVLIDEEGADVPKDLKEKMELAGKFANECAEKDIPCEIRITIDEPIGNTLHNDHLNLEPTIVNIPEVEKIHPSEVKPEQVKYHNENPIYHQEPTKDRPEPSSSPRSELDEIVLEPTIHSIPHSVKFIPDEAKPTEVRYMNDSEIQHDTVEFKEKAMQDYGKEHDDHILEPQTEKLPDVDKVNPEDVKPVEVRRMNESEVSHERTEFEPKPMQDYGKEHDDHILEPQTEKLPDVDKVNPDEVKPTEVKWHNEVPIYHEEPKPQTPDPTIIPKTEHADETVLEPTTPTIRYNGTRVLPEEVKPTEVRRMNESEVSHERTEFEPKQMQDYGVEHDDHILEPQTEKLPDVDKVNPEDVKPVEVRRMNESEVSHERTEFEPKQMQDYGVEHDDHILEPQTEKLPDVDKVNPEEVKPTEVKWHNEVPIYHEEPKPQTPDPTIIPKTEHADETVLEPTTPTIRYNGTRTLPEEVKPKDIPLLNDSVEHPEPVEFEPKQMQDYGVEHDDHILEPQTEKLPDVDKVNPEDVKPTEVIHLNESEHDENHNSISEKELQKPEAEAVPAIDPKISNVIERLNIAINEFKTAEKSSLFGNNEANPNDDPFADKDDLTEY